MRNYDFIKLYSELLPNTTTTESERIGKSQNPIYIMSAPTNQRTVGLPPTNHKAVGFSSNVQSETDRTEKSDSQTITMPSRYNTILWGAIPTLPHPNNFRSPRNWFVQTSDSSNNSGSRIRSSDVT